jgi:hypothetical protein
MAKKSIRVTLNLRDALLFSLQRKRRSSFRIAGWKYRVLLAMIIAAIFPKNSNCIRLAYFKAGGMPNG